MILFQVMRYKFKNSNIKEIEFVTTSLKILLSSFNKNNGLPPSSLHTEAS